jgi:hypothetical protein
LPKVNWRGGEEPSAAANQMFDRSSFASLSILQTTKATVLPSGESLGSFTPVNA